ncbi:MAG TPA: DHA2 family efflux MFS transporter permease subunit [Acetobacteraceae bacterium]
MDSSDSDDPRRWLIPLVVAFGFMMEGLDSTIITVAIPNMAASLHETPVRLSLAITSYLLSLAVFIPISGWIADRFGARSVICSAFAVFTVASALCGLSQNLPMLVGMRILQGIGGAMMSPVGRLILLRAFPRNELVRAMSYVTIPSLVGPTLGPILGGLITSYLSWRWIFYANIPFGIGAIVVAFRIVENVRATSASRFDTLGFLICGVALASLQFVLETVGRGAVSVVPQVLVFAIGAGCLVGYWRYARGHRNPVLDLTLFGIRSFRVGSLAGGLCRIGISAPAFLLPLLLQLGFGMSPIQSGSLTFATSLGAIPIRFVSAVMLRRYGFRRLLVRNSVLCGVAIAELAALSGATPHWVILLAILWLGLVRSVQFNCMQMLSYADMPQSRLSRATSLGSVVQQLTMGFGVSISAALLGILAGGGGVPTVPQFRLVFVLVGLLPLAALPGFLTLQPEDGAEVSGHVVVRSAGA